MSVVKIWEIILNIVLIPVLVMIIVVMTRKTKNPRGLFVTFFIFAMVAYALDDIYWVAYDFLRPDKWMPFAANEIAICATMLLLGSAMSTRIDKNVSVKVSEIVFNIAFLGGCICLWIAWSGEWIQDIIFTLPYMYFLYVLLRGMRINKALSKTETYFAVAICAAVIILQATGLFVSKGTAQILYTINYGILDVSTLLMFIKNINSRRKGLAPETLLFQSFALFFWTIVVLDMSGGWFYNIGLFLQMAAILLMFSTVLHVVDDKKPAMEQPEIGGIS
ncbi:hypothetical protein [Butyrivibrio sp. INlla16]|uniref:hypothetical protein n=1 Tax=Butyrivibrio sp. INlla16 TaxID=1520807 RepID=UPI000889F00C|nr:hypothetical protein [Butyrivibrio sp. INlla16]SDB53009.1 hypothetical protein SAMN02910263_02674 [Butyrivibrio sp. INlla16]